MDAFAGALGLDFGTTNTVLSQAAGGATRPVAFQAENEIVSALRSALCFWRAHQQSAETMVKAGPAAIEQFIRHPGECRFIQSFKTFAASHHFAGTLIYGKRY